MFLQAEFEILRNCLLSPSTFHCFFLTAMDRRIVSILGYDATRDVIYGVARTRIAYVRCNITKCVSIRKESWLAIRDLQNTTLATEIAFVPETGHDFTDAPISVFQLTDNEGNIWGGI